VYCVPYGGRLDDSGFTLAGQNLFFTANAWSPAQPKTGVSFTNHVAQRAFIHAENRSSDRANRQPMVCLITSIQFVEPILVRSSRE
jgi:hypothetical protein